MNIKKAASCWEVTEKKARKICKSMGIDPKDIPENLRPIYIPDKRYTKNPHRFYVFVLDVIANTHMDLEGFDSIIIETCVEQLRKAGLIVLKHGVNEGSLDYHDYLISINQELFYNWKNAKMNNKIVMLSPLVPSLHMG